MATPPRDASQPPQWATDRSSFRAACSRGRFVVLPEKATADGV